MEEGLCHDRHLSSEGQGRPCSRGVARSSCLGLLSGVVGRRMVVSGLKPTGARHVFPCMDDPAMKATFDVIIEHPSDQIALTSSPSESTTTLANGWIRETFYRTSKLSTHLLGFALFEGLTELERYSSRGQVVRVWSPFDPNTSPAAEVALNTTLDAISNMKDLLGLDYLLQKTDVLPVPGQIVPYDVYSGLLMATDSFVNVSVVMNNWVSNAGYPYVTLRQTVENNENISDDSSKGEWVLGKADSNGFYRVNYGPGNWKLLADQLLTNHTVFDVSTRASLIDDAFNLARASRLLIPTALDLTRYLDKEDDYVPWKAALRALHYLLTVMSKSPSYNSLKSVLQQGIASGSQGEWNFVWRKYNSSSTTSPQNHCFFNPTDSSIVLSIYDPGTLPVYHTIVPGRAWQTPSLDGNLPGNSFMETGVNYNKGTLTMFVTLTVIDIFLQLRQLKELIDIPRLRRILERAEEQTDLHIQWLAGNEKYVSDWLDKTDV
ncbi:hypothetical protein Bbelb_190950 [Branchiostoma belcheri]|nr:hypothetical protein Bbelb_190950 [Branchiostoma belcheri]